MNEGYIKFKANWKKTLPLEDVLLEELNYYRSKMYAAGFIGRYDNGIGYGNISIRIKETNQFYISGSATGGIKKLTNKHYAKVNAIHILENQVDCEGAIVASSESMSHAVIYQELLWVNSVIHLHHLGFWKALLHQIPTTADKATYGSPEMCQSIISLIKNTDLPALQIFVMKGHEEGVFAFGKDLAETKQVINRYFMQYMS